MDSFALFRRLALVSTGATVLLVAIGGLVRATKSGLGCGTDWPDCGGRLIPALHTRAEIIEFSHRSAAAVVVALLAALAIVAVRRHRDSPRLMWPAVAAFVLVLVQAGLGAIVVMLELEAASVVIHLGTAMALLALLVYLSLASSVAGGRLGTETDAAVGRRVAGAAGAVFVLLLVGSYVTGSDAGYVFPDWPLMNGRLVPDLGVESHAIHFLHRALAAVVGVALMATLVPVVRRARELPVAARLSGGALALFFVEVLVGAANVWTELNAAVVTLHLAVGTLVWAALAGVVVVSHPALQGASAPTAVPRRAPVLESS